MRHVAILAAVLCFIGLLSACAPETVPPLQESIRYDENGEAVGRTVYAYDEDGNRTKCTHYDADGTVTGVDVYTFADGLCVGYTRLSGEQQEVFSVAAEAGNRLQFTTDMKIRECTAQGVTARYIGYADTGLQFCETFDADGYRVQYDRYNAAGEAYISYTADGERHYVEATETADSFSITEWDAYDTKRVYASYSVDDGKELLREEYDMYGTCTRRVKYGYDGDALLYRADMVIDLESIVGIALYNAEGEKVVEQAPSAEGNTFEIIFPEDSYEETENHVIQVVEYTEKGYTSVKYDVATGKTVK